MGKTTWQTPKSILKLLHASGNGIVCGPMISQSAGKIFARAQGMKLCEFCSGNFSEEMSAAAL